MRPAPKPKPFLDDARRDWQFAAFAWLLRHCGGYAGFLDTTLVLPTPEHFPDRGLKGHAAVSALFRRVRDHAGMADWPCTVEPAGDAPRAEVDDPARIPVFTYSRGVEPVTLVANFALDLARYLVSTLEEPPPGGEARREAAIELGTVFMGFGIFAANSAVGGRRHELSEGELAHALAIFCLLRGLEPENADEHLNPHFRKYLRLAIGDLAQYGKEFGKLRAVATVPPGTERALPARAP
ncbi:MAG TPA: hypothetical protein VFP37_11070 [Steroidobacteraceae bacterium]|nr:hypothetical protein [Steroidobacteraceae bacterium]